MTSNQVETVSEEFKSRTRLAIHYGNLKRPQRLKIWRKFFTRLRDITEESVVDFDDLDNRLDDLADMEMNGRQIRNAITAARQLAQFEGSKLTYKQLKHVLGAGTNFGGA